MDCRAFSDSPTITRWNIFFLVFTDFLAKRGHWQTGWVLHAARERIDPLDDIIIET